MDVRLYTYTYIFYENDEQFLLSFMHVYAPFNCLIIQVYISLCLVLHLLTLVHSFHSIYAQKYFHQRWLIRVLLSL